METLTAVNRDDGPAALESDSLGIEMATAFAHMVESWSLSPPEAMDRLAETPADDSRVLNCRPDQLTWMDLAQLTQCQPELAQRRWEELKQIARDDLKNGHRAAKVVEAATTSPSARAKFIALREELAAEWSPRNGIEWTLIDTIAQAHTVGEIWTSRVMLLSMLECESRPDKSQRTWTPPRVSESEAINQAAAMVDRFNRIVTRAIRALRDLRRYSPTVIVQNAGNVNVAEQQVNVGSNRQK